MPTNVRCSFFALSGKGMHLEAKGPKEFDANTGVDLGFSRGGGADFQKIFNQLIFRALPKHCLSLFWPLFVRRRLNFEKNGVFRHFLENFDQKMRFFGARSPLKISIYWRQRRL